MAAAEREDPRWSVQDDIHAATRRPPSHAWCPYAESGTGHVAPGIRIGATLERRPIQGRRPHPQNLSLAIVLLWCCFDRWRASSFSQDRLSGHRVSTSTDHLLKKGKSPKINIIQCVARLCSTPPFGAPLHAMQGTMQTITKVALTDPPGSTTLTIFQYQNRGP